MIAVTDRLTPRQAAKIMGVDVQFLNYQMDMGIWDLGIVGESRNKKKRTHLIYRCKVEKIIGREIREEEIK